MRDTLESMSEGILAFARMTHGRGCHLEWHQLEAGGWTLMVRRRTRKANGVLVERTLREVDGCTGYEAAHALLERLWRE